MPSIDKVIEVFIEDRKIASLDVAKYAGSIDSITKVIIERDKRMEEIMVEVKEHTKILSKAVVDMAENKTRTDNIAIGIRDICIEVKGLSKQLVEAQRQDASERSQMKIDIVALQTTSNERWKGMGIAFSTCLIISVALSKLLVGS